MTHTIRQAQAQGMTNVYRFELDGTNLPLDDWCADHLSVAAHQNIADQLVQYIQTTFPDWPTDTYATVLEIDTAVY